MTQLLVQGGVILAQGPLSVNDDEIHSSDAIYPAHVIPGWQIVDVALPVGFTCGGYTWDGSAVVAKPVIVPPAPVPQSVTMRQARLAMLKIGKLDAVASAIAQMPSPQKEAAQIEWEYSIEVERHRPLVQTLGPALGLSDADIDQLFILAATL